MPTALEPIVMPELHAGDQTARVSAWLAELEEAVIAGVQLWHQNWFQSRLHHEFNSAAISPA